MSDAGTNLALSELEDCDLYFKRSYDRKTVENLAPPLRDKIVPYGLNYSCKSRFRPGFWKLFAGYRACVLQSVCCEHWMSFSRLVNHLQTPAHLLLNNLVSRKSRNCMPLWEDLECPPETMREGTSRSSKRASGTQSNMRLPWQTSIPNAQPRCGPSSDTLGECFVEA